MNADQKRRAEQLTNIFENGTPEFQYAYVENLGDGRGYTCGRVGFTTGTSDALAVIKLYTQRKPHNPLVKYISELERLDSLPDDSTERGDVSRLHGFVQAWKLAAKDKVFCEVQDTIVDEWYFNPAMQHASRVGIQTALGKAIFYDTIIQHGDGEDPDSLLALIEATKKHIGFLPKGNNEKDWIAHFLEVRRHDLVHAFNVDTREVWKQSVGRVDALKQLVISKNFNLDAPLTVVWEGQKYTLH